MPKSRRNVTCRPVPWRSLKLHTPTLEVPTGAALLAMGLVRIRKSSSGRRGKLWASSDPTYESRIQAATQGIANGLYKSIAAAAKEQNVSHDSSCDYSLNWFRYHVRHWVIDVWECISLIDMPMRASNYYPLHRSKLSLTGATWHPYHASMQNNNSSGGPIASSSNLHRQPQTQPGHPYNAHGFPIQFYNYGTHHNQPRT